MNIHASAKPVERAKHSETTDDMAARIDALETRLDDLVTYLECNFSRDDPRNLPVAPPERVPLFSALRNLFDRKPLLVTGGIMVAAFGIFGVMG